MLLLLVDEVIMRSGGWWYKDRLGRTRGPCELITLKTAWGGGIIDKHTFIWGEDMDEWAPIHMVYGLERAIATWEGLLLNLKLFPCLLSFSSFLLSWSLGSGNDVIICQFVKKRWLARFDTGNDLVIFIGWKYA